jgi:peroxiredoxin Q/BCP
VAEGQGFRDEFQKFESKNVKIIGMSADSPEKQNKFIVKQAFQFPLLSDESKDVLKAYHAWGKKKLYGREYDGIHRISYLIDEKGMIIKVYPKVNTKTHAQEVLLDI